MKSKQIKKILFVALGVFLMPLAVLAAEWGVSIDSSGNWSAAVGSSGGWSMTNAYGLPSGSIMGIISNFLFWLLAIFAMAGIIGFVISGIIYLVSTGETTMIDRAKSAMKYSLVGILVGLSGFVIMQAVMTLLNGANNTF
jgi:hypothetical protein